MPYALTDYGAMVNGFAVIKEKHDYYLQEYPCTYLATGFKRQTVSNQS